MDKSKTIGIIVLVVLIVLLLGGLVTGYMALKDQVITLNDICYDGIQDLLAGRPSPCPTETLTTFTGAEITFTYPQTWHAANTGTQLVVTAPDNSILSFPLQGVPESSVVDQAGCQSLGDTFLSTARANTDPTALLLDVSAGTANNYPACVFALQLNEDNNAKRIQFIYIVNNAKGYMVQAVEIDGSKLLPELTAALNSFQIL